MLPDVTVPSMLTAACAVPEVEFGEMAHGAQAGWEASDLVVGQTQHLQLGTGTQLLRNLHRMEENTHITAVKWGCLACSRGFRLSLL